ncbi:hypothetical protein NECAME_18691 [Necator americanus]|uniref:Uncharacterized protein n=1 Tax=Necator americanus TaxID=51031 RepID=W2SSY7_NECAM|nr:hypothetical protein NECAME_18691 [Necator americanus]ETN72740.1 hypothetical protein NECAME_18691 [Necator americanus]
MRDFWDEYFWLPENISWTDMKDSDSIRYPRVTDLQYTLLFGFALLVDSLAKVSSNELLNAHGDFVSMFAHGQQGER